MARVTRGEHLYDVARLSTEIGIARNILEFDELTISKRYFATFGRPDLRAVPDASQQCSL